MSYTERAQNKRSRSLTEKGRLYELELQQTNRLKLEREIRTQICKMELLIEDGKIEELSIEFSNINHLFDQFLKCHARCQLLIQSDQERHEDDYSTDSLDRKVFSVKQRAYELLNNSTERFSGIEEVQQNLNKLCHVNL